MPLTEAQRATLQHELVAVVDGDIVTYYTHDQFLGAQQGAQLQRMSELVPEGSTLRAAQRALQRLRTVEEAQRVQQLAVGALRASGEPVEVSPEEVRSRVVALVTVGT